MGLGRCYGFTVRPRPCRGRARAVLGCAVLPQESATTTRGFRTCGRARSVCWAMYINKGKIRGSGGRMPGSRAVYGPSNLHDSRMLSATRTSQVSGWCGRRWPPPLLVSAASIDIYATCRPGSARGCRRRGPPSVATWHTRPEASRRRVSGESAQVGGAVVGGRPPSAATWHTRPPASSSK